ncbi:Flagellar basal-body rod protein FlgB [Lutibaculum baratangense AMV1]|uniref:Flagellar basal body rod protein FlgB n=2 Tax=Lutibaculum TaxID=1358438 RepID=V4RL49_9HYPH|nr:Flagellar basal-body rod protein FlgB [Lutibaculum baratangense AMV1]
MSWLQQRQDVLAENVANADTPRYAARDLESLDLSKYVNEGRKIRPVRTDVSHMTLDSAGGAPRIVSTSSFETTPSGNSVALEEEMMKVAQTQMDYQLASGLYARSVSVLKTALGRA